MSPMTEHTVLQGECLSSIAKAHGTSWQALWNAPENAALRAKRGSPDILFPGDVVTIPDAQPRIEDGSTENRHRFRVPSSVSTLRVTLRVNDKPLGEEPYELIVDGTLIEGTTDAAGLLEQPIAPAARAASLVLKKTGAVYTFLLGHIDPITEVSGIQQRLQNLGFYIGEHVDGLYGPKTASGVRAFQEKHGLVVDGIPGPQTQSRLKEVYGC